MTDGVHARARLDRWLWAARFYKTRAQAKLAIESGKVHYEDARAKPAKEVAIGARLRIRRELEERTVIVTGLSERRGPAAAAAALYEETPDSVARREAAHAQRRAGNAGFVPPSGRPDKRARRQIARFKERAALDPPDPRHEP